MKLVMQEGERVLYKDGPKGKILFLWFFRSLFFAVLITLIFSWVFMIPVLPVVLTAGPSGIIYYYSAVFIVLLIIVFLYHVALRKTYKYHITNDRIIFEGGIILRKIKSVPYHKVTDVSISQNIIERALGISKTNVHTAGTGMQRPEIQFVGLAHPENPQSVIVKRLRSFQTSRHASAYSE